MTTLDDFGGWPATLEALTSGSDITSEHAEAVLDTILDAGATDAQIAAYITSLRHKGETVGSPVINFRVKCKVAGCKSMSCWGLDGMQPTHCRDHGPLVAGLVCTVGRPRRKKSGRNASYGAVRGPSFHIKCECLF